MGKNKTSGKPLEPDKPETPPKPAAPKTCTRCRGARTIPQGEVRHDGLPFQEATCPKCNGSGTE